MNEPSSLPPEVVSIRDLHIRFTLGREKKTSLAPCAATSLPHQRAVYPPSITSSAPVTNLDSSEAR